jgi:hypothetical protein
MSLERETGFCPRFGSCTYLGRPLKEGEERGDFNICLYNPESCPQSPNYKLNQQSSTE